MTITDSTTALKSNMSVPVLRVRDSAKVER